jgi:hypothetical protein
VVDQRTSKQWYQSKTMVFNLVSALIMMTQGLATLFAGLGAVLPESAIIWVVFGINIVNMGLRAVTNSGIVSKPNAVAKPES